MFPDYLFNTTMWAAIWPLPVAALLVSSAVYLFFFSKIDKTKIDRDGVFIVIVAFAMLGIVTGFLTGLSREPAVKAVLPAVLSLFAGFSMFLISSKVTQRVIISLSVVVFSTTLVLGTVWGSVLRAESEEARQSAKFWKRHAMTEIEVNEFREALGLPKIILPTQLQKEPKTQDEEDNMSSDRKRMEERGPNKRKNK